VLLRDGDHQAQVRLDERPLRVFTLTCLPPQFALAGRRQVPTGAVEVEAGLIATFDRLGETDFVILGGQGGLADFSEVQTDEISLVPLAALFGQQRPLCSKSNCGVRRHAATGSGQPAELLGRRTARVCAPYDTGEVKSANPLLLIQGFEFTLRVLR